VKLPGDFAGLFTKESLDEGVDILVRASLKTLTFDSRGHGLQSHEDSLDLVVA